MSTSYGTRQGCTEVHQADLRLPISRYMLQQPALGTATSLIHHIGTNVVEKFGGSWAVSGILKRCQTFPSHVYICPSGLSMLHELEAASKLVSKRFYRKQSVHISSCVCRPFDSSYLFRLVCFFSPAPHICTKTTSLSSMQLVHKQHAVNT